MTSRPFKNVTQALLASGLLGTLAIKIGQIVTGNGGNAMFHRPIWCVIILATAGSFFLGLLLAFPIFVFVRSKEKQSTDGLPMPWWAPLAILIHIGNPKWIVPNTVSIPLVIVMSILVGFVTYTLVMCVIFGMILKP